MSAEHLANTLNIPRRTASNGRLDSMWYSFSLQDRSYFPAPRKRSSLACNLWGFIKSSEIDWEEWVVVCDEIETAGELERLEA
jgi:hypothetical protein